MDLWYTLSSEVEFLAGIVDLDITDVEISKRLQVDLPGNLRELPRETCALTLACNVREQILQYFYTVFKSKICQSQLLIAEKVCCHILVVKIVMSALVQISGYADLIYAFLKIFKPKQTVEVA